MGPATRTGSIAVPFLGLVGAIQAIAPNVASTALVSASRSLHMTGGTLALASSVGTLALAATVISTGLLADRLGRRRVLMAALLTATAGQLLVAIAPATWLYLTGQMIAGVGLGAIYGASFAYIRRVAEPEKLSAAIGVYSAAIGLGTMAFTFVGGVMSGSSWRVAFLLVPALSLLSFVLVPLVLPKEKPITRGEKADVPGQLLLAFGIVAFLYGISQMANGFGDPRTFVPLFGGLVLCACFALWESRYEGRFFPVELFRSPLFLAAIAAGFVYNFGTAVSFLQLTDLWQYVNGLRTTQVAVWQLPLLGSGIVAAVVTGRLMAKSVSNRTALAGGTVITVAGFLLLALFHSSTSIVGFLPGMVLAGGGVIVCSIPFGNLIMRQAPPRHFGAVTSSKTTVGQFCYSLGFSLSTVVVSRLTDGGVVHRLEHAGVPPNQISTGLDAVNVYASQSTSPTTSVGHEALRQASTSYGNSFAVMMLLASALLLAGGAMGWWLLRHGESAHEPVAAPLAAATPEAVATV